MTWYDEIGHCIASMSCLHDGVSWLVKRRFDRVGMLTIMASAVQRYAVYHTEDRTRLDQMAKRWTGMVHRKRGLLDRGAATASGQDR